MKKLALILAFVALLAGTVTNQAEARQGSHIQIGVGNHGFYFGYGYRNYGYRGYGYGAYGGGLTYNWGYNYPYYYEPVVPYTNHYYYLPRGYRNYFAPRYFNPYRGGRHWRY